MRVHDSLGRIERLKAEARCLNCESPATGTFCAQCGQRTDTHRIDLLALFAGAFRGLWEFDLPLLRTVRDLTLRPGRVAREYLGGRRERYWSPLKYALVVFFISAIASVVMDPLGLFDPSLDPLSPESVIGAVKRLVPLYLMFTLGVGLQLAFRKARLRYSEHMIVPLYGVGHGMLFPWTLYAVFGSVIEAFLPDEPDLAGIDASDPSALMEVVVPWLLAPQNIALGVSLLTAVVLWPAVVAHGFYGASWGNTVVRFGLALAVAVVLAIGIPIGLATFG